MWSAQIDGVWHEVGSDEALVEWARAGRLRRESVVHHSSLAHAGRAGDVRFLDPIFGPPPVIHEMARSARNWGIGGIFCGVAAPVATFMGLRAWMQIRKAPSKYSNSADAILGVLLGGVVMFLLLIGLAGVFIRGAADEKAGGVIRAGETLSDARRGFHTQVHDSAPRSGPPPGPPADVFTVVQFASPVGPLPAYVTPRPSGGTRRPAVLWLQGGFDPSLDASAWRRAPRNNDQSARAFREAGLVLMLPARRGGNDNPAPRETFFGEVDDVLAAADYLAKLDYVDPARVYLGGHSTGGTLALLVAESTDRFRATFAFGAVGNIKSYANDATFDVSNEAEVRVRSPMFFLDGIRRPTFVIEGGDRPSNAGAVPYLKPQNAAVPVRTFVVPGVTHFSILAPITELVARKIARSTDGEITLTDDELAAAAAYAR